MILQSILPVELITAKPGDAEAPIDKIARVCCALTNLCDSIVPFAKGYKSVTVSGTH